MEIKLRKVNGKYNFGDLCGTVFYKNGIRCEINQYDGTFGKIGILIDQNNNELYMTCEMLSFAFGVEDFISRLKSNYDIDIVEDVTVALFSGNAVQEAINLKQIGFDYLEIFNGRIMARSRADEDMILDVTKKMKEGFADAKYSLIPRSSETIEIEEMYKHLIY